jgi:hypothetical protein
VFLTDSQVEYKMFVNYIKCVCALNQLYNGRGGGYFACLNPQNSVILRIYLRL